ncbi:MAG: hypothetical protein WD278_19665 [Pirellulales bacterium]
MNTGLRPWQRPSERASRRRPQFGLAGALFAVLCASGFLAGYHYGARRPVALNMISLQQASFVRSDSGIDPGDLSTILDSVKARFSDAGLVYTVELVHKEHIGTSSATFDGTKKRMGDIFVWMSLDHGAYSEDTMILYRKVAGKWEVVAVARGQSCGW